MQRCRDGRLATVYAQLPAGVMNMEVDGPFRQSQDDAHFPTGLSHSCPLQASFFPFCQRFH
jgi:hypothetical protein